MNIAFIFIIILILLSSCKAVSEKTKNLKMPGSKCPTDTERTLKDIFCRE